MRLSLGIDCSTQSMTAVVIEVDTPSVVAVENVHYVHDLEASGIDSYSYLIPPRVPGEADQPPLLFLKALDLLFQRLSQKINMEYLCVINVSAQQHSHVYLSSFEAFHAQANSDADLSTLYADAFSYQVVPTWMTHNTQSQVREISSRLGAERMLALSGSDLPLRFTAPVIRRVAQQFPDIFATTKKIHLLSSFLSAVLTGDAHTAIDYGNASGTALMDYKLREWSPVLLEATLAEYPLAELLPPLAPAHSVAGHISPYFHRHYRIPKEALVLVGSGDNPLTKVLSEGDLLSLGTSFVFMAHTPRLHPYANAMYDGFDRPFSFACRTNGAICWDRIREYCGVEADDFKKADEALAASPIGKYMLHWFPLPESFPPAPADQLSNASGKLEIDYPAIVDTSLAELCVLTSHIFPSHEGPLYLCGGPAPSLVERVSALWNKEVIVLGTAGAGLGAAVVAAGSIHTASKTQDLIASITGMKKPYLAPRHVREGAQKFLKNPKLKEFLQTQR